MGHAEGKFQPLHDYVLAKKSGGEEMTRGGIALPDMDGTPTGRPWRCVVEAVGPGARQDGEFRPTTLVPGDVIYAPPFSDFEIRLRGETYMLLPERKVLGKVVGS